MVTGTLSIFLHFLYALIDLRSTIPYVAPLISGMFKRTPQLFVKPFELCSSIGESTIARRVYHNCVVTICDPDTLADHVDLEMFYFDVIMGMHWLASCYATIDSQTKIMHFQFP